MKRITPHIWSGILTCVAITACSHYLAGAPQAKDAAPAANSHIAVIDIKKTFDQHIRFGERIRRLRAKVKTAEKAMIEESNKIRELTKEREGLAVGQPLRVKLELQIAARSSQVKLKMIQMRNDFIKQETSIYAEVYREIVTAVAAHCRQHGIDLVVQLEGIRQIDGNTERSKVTAAMQQTIVFADGIDITVEILKRLNRPIEENDM